MTLEPSFSDAWYETFGRPDDTVTAREVAFLLDVLPPPPATVLDVACGSGRHARALLERGYRVTEELKHVVGARLFTTLDYGDGHNDDFSWQLYEPHELVALGETAELTCETICAGFDVRSSPRGEVARMQAVFRRPGTRLDAEP